MASLNELAKGFGFVENMARSLALKEAQAPAPAPAPAAPRLNALGQDPAKLQQYYRDNPASRPRGVPPPPPLPPPGGGAAPPGGGAAPPGGGPVIPPAAAAVPNPTQRYASPGHAGLAAGTHKPWSQSLPAMPAGWDPNTTRYYGTYGKGWENWTKPDISPGHARNATVPRTKQDLWRSMNINIASMRQAQRAATGQPALELASKAYREPTRAGYEGKFHKFRHPGDLFQERTTAAANRGTFPENRTGPAPVAPDRYPTWANKGEVAGRQSTLRGEGVTNRRAQEDYSRLNYPDVFANRLPGNKHTRWQYRQGNTKLRNNQGRLVPSPYITPGGYNTLTKKVTPP
jgi:hypothetical protein